MNSRIYEGWVQHQRRAPREHEFRYRVFMLYLDLAELDSVFAGRLLWSTRRPALAWFKRSDHLGDPNEPLASAVGDLVQAQTGSRPAGPIRLLTHLRYFGYCMNPVSFYYCWNESDTAVDFIVAEVHNTPWGEQHCYVLDCSSVDSSTRQHHFDFRKEFHVSPFMGMDQRYRWHLPQPGARLSVTMSNIESERRIFTATMDLEAYPTSAARLAYSLIRQPFMTGKVIAAIYWQALRLWLKRVPFRAHPAANGRTT